MVCIQLCSTFASSHQQSSSVYSRAQDIYNTLSSSESSTLSKSADIAAAQQPALLRASRTTWKLAEQQFDDDETINADKFINNPLFTTSSTSSDDISDPEFLYKAHHENREVPSYIQPDFRYHAESNEQRTRRMHTQAVESGANAFASRQPSTLVESQIINEDINVVANIEGMTNIQDVVRPSPTIAIGLDHYVQTINNAFAIFDKHTNKMVSGPHHINVLFSGFEPDCLYNDMDTEPTVVFDHDANRWIFSKFSTMTAEQQQAKASPFRHHICIAVSTTELPTSAFVRYAFGFHHRVAEPKLHVYPPLYYVLTVSAWADDWSDFLGAQVCGLNRALLTSAATEGNLIWCSELIADSRTIRSIDWAGQIFPLAPQFVPLFALGIDPFLQPYPSVFDSLLQYTLHINWEFPYQSYVKLSNVISIPAVNFPCPHLHGECAPQPRAAQDVAGHFLSFGARIPSFSLSYRVLGSIAEPTEILVLNHATEIRPATSDAARDNIIGLRWIELRRNQPKFISRSQIFVDGGRVPENINFNVHASGIYEDQTDILSSVSSTAAERKLAAMSRLLGSVSIDSHGNMMLGYVATSTEVSPSLRVAFRAFGENNFHTDTLVIEGQGSSFFPSSSKYNAGQAIEYGFHTVATVDPVDDCTLYVSGSYQNGYDYSKVSTRIFAARFSSCRSITSPSLPDGVFMHFRQSDNIPGYVTLQYYSKYVSYEAYKPNPVVNSDDFFIPDPFVTPEPEYSHLPSGSHQRSVSMWIFVEEQHFTAPHNIPLISFDGDQKAACTNNREFTLILSDGHLCFQSCALLICGPVLPAPGHFAHLSAVYHDDTLELYVNANRQTIKIVSDLRLNTEGSVINIGKRASKCCDPTFVGFMTQLNIWNRSLTYDEVVQDFSVGVYRPYDLHKLFFPGMTVVNAKTSPISTAHHYDDGTAMNLPSLGTDESTAYSIRYAAAGNLKKDLLASYIGSSQGNNIVNDVTGNGFDGTFSNGFVRSHAFVWPIHIPTHVEQNSVITTTLRLSSHLLSFSKKILDDVRTEVLASGMTFDATELSSTVLKVSFVVEPLDFSFGFNAADFRFEPSEITFTPNTGIAANVDFHVNGSLGSYRVRYVVDGSPEMVSLFSAPLTNEFVIQPTTCSPATITTVAGRPSAAIVELDTTQVTPSVPASFGSHVHSVLAPRSFSFASTPAEDFFDVQQAKTANTYNFKPSVTLSFDSSLNAYYYQIYSTCSWASYPQRIRPTYSSASSKTPMLMPVSRVSMFGRFVDQYYVPSVDSYVHTGPIRPTVRVNAVNSTLDVLYASWPSVANAFSTYPGSSNYVDPTTYAGFVGITKYTVEITTVPPTKTSTYDVVVDQSLTGQQLANTLWVIQLHNSSTPNAYDNLVENTASKTLRIQRFNQVLLDGHLYYVRVLPITAHGPAAQPGTASNVDAHTQVANILAVKLNPTFMHLQPSFHPRYYNYTLYFAPSHIQVSPSQFVFQPYFFIRPGTFHQLFKLEQVIDRENQVYGLPKWYSVDPNVHTNGDNDDISPLVEFEQTGYIRVATPPVFIRNPPVTNQGETSVDLLNEQFEFVLTSYAKDPSVVRRYTFNVVLNGEFRGGQLPESLGGQISAASSSSSIIIFMTTIMTIIISMFLQYI